jgi:acetyl-CoA carboxylase carboxyl transferase subunit beta
MAWFKRQKAGILTNLNEQKEIPDGQWVKCDSCSEILNRRELEDNLFVCPKCSHHFYLTAQGYFDLLFDDDAYALYDEDIYPSDPLGFTDKRPYTTRLEEAQQKTGFADAARSAVGRVGGHRLAVVAHEFSFIGGSLGSVVGEIISRAIKRSCEERTPLLLISRGGGARMMEGALSLMQLAKTSAHLTRLAENKLPFISLLTDPTTGGITASYAMLGDFNLAEPKALIGFAGPRVIRETMGQDLPDGFQRSEFLQEHGFVDLVVDRRNLRERLIQLLNLIMET